MPVVSSPSSKHGDGIASPLTRSELIDLNRFSHQLLSVAAAASDGHNGNGNVFLSPISIAAAAGMIARGVTPDSRTSYELEALFGGIQLKNAVNETDGNLFADALMASVETDEASGTEITMANSIWAVDSVKQQFKDDLKELFDAETMELSTGDAINNWVANATEGMITDLVPAGPVDPDTVAMVVNAIHFKGSWRKAFDPINTESGAFYGPSGPMRVEMMSTSLGGGKTSDMAKVAEVETFVNPTRPTKVVELDFGEAVGGEWLGSYSAVIAMPSLSEEEKLTEGTVALDRLLQDLADTPELWDMWMYAVETLGEPMELTMPRFKVESEMEMIPVLQKMKLSTPFRDVPNQFLDLYDDPKVKIGNIKHKAVLEVNEEGAEAAAATAVSFVAFSLPMELERMVVDQPFLFFIRNRRTDMMLFSGRIVSPSY